MIKTIKVKKQLRLDELIKHVWDDRLFPRDYKVDGKIGESRYVSFNGGGMLRAHFGYHENDVFTVEVEEKITEETKLLNAVAYVWDEITYQYFYMTGFNQSIKEMKESLSKNQTLYEVLMPVENKTMLVWEREE